MHLDKAVKRVPLSLSARKVVRGEQLFGRWREPITV